MCLRVVNESSNRRIAETPMRRVRFPRDPEEVAVFRRRVEECNLPAYGRYRLKLRLDDEVAAVRPFWLLHRV